VRDRWNWLYPLLVTLAAVWIGIGRAFLGSGGWLLIFLAPVLPVLLIYAGIALSMIRGLAKDSIRVFDARLRALSIASVAMLFTFGFTVVDFGDSSDSVASVLSQFLRLLGHSGANSTILNISELLAVVSGALGVFLTLIVWAKLAQLSSRHAASTNRPKPVWRRGSALPPAGWRFTSQPPPPPTWPPPPPPA
jgi:hypothetical protein